MFQGSTEDNLATLSRWLTIIHSMTWPMSLHFAKTFSLHFMFCKHFFWVHYFVFTRMLPLINSVSWLNITAKLHFFAFTFSLQDMTEQLWEKKRKLCEEVSWLRVLKQILIEFYTFLLKNPFPSTNIRNSGAWNPQGARTRADGRSFFIHPLFLKINFNNFLAFWFIRFS